jgi:hypothetical protein
MQALFSRRALVAGAAAFTAVRGAPVRAAGARSITIAIQYGYAYLPVVIADRMGFFARHLAVAGVPEVAMTIQKISGAPAINDALISGSVDIGAYGLPGMLIAAQRRMGRAATGRDEFCSIHGQGRVVESRAGPVAGCFLSAGLGTKRKLSGGGWRGRAAACRGPSPRNPSAKCPKVGSRPGMGPTGRS